MLARLDGVAVWCRPPFGTMHSRCGGFLILYNHETRRRCVRPGLTQHTQIRSLYKTSVSVHCSRPIQGTGPSRSGPEAPGLHCPPLLILSLRVSSLGS